MKPLHRTHSTYRKVIFREIRHSLSRFFAIFAIVALGVGFLAGLMATTPDMRLSADAYFDDTNFMDIRVVSTMGLTEDDVRDIRQISGVVGVMPAYQADTQVRTAGEDTIVTRFHSLPQGRETDDPNYQNQLAVVDGRLPEQPGECVVQESPWGDSPVHVGDELCLLPEDGDQSDTFATDTFTVVGIVRSAYYISIERESTDVGSGSVGMMAYLAESDFTMEAYANVFVTVDGAKPLTSMLAPYEEHIQPVIDALEALGDVREQIRLEEVREEAADALAEGRQELEDKRAETEQTLADALAELTEARQKVTDAQRELEDGEKKLADGKKELADKKSAFEAEIALKEKQLQEGELALLDGKAQLSEGKAQLQELEKQLADGKAELQQLIADGKAEEAEAKAQELAMLQAGYEIGLSEYETQEATLQEKENELTLARTQLEAGKKQAEAEFAAAEKTLAESRAQLDSGWEELEAGRAELEQGEKEYADGRKEADEELGKAQDELDKAAAELDTIEAPVWYVFDRMNNVGYASFAGNAQKVEAIATVFPIFFFLVAALVALTTMTRMVEEERTQIGTLKALGYGKGKIALKYLIYAGTATITGSVFGLLIGLKVFPTVIWRAYDIMYTLPPLLTPFNWGLALVSSLTAVVCILLVTIFACVNSLKECPARLMRPRAPKAGKRVFLERITPLWSRMKFTHKVTARNLIRYKKRFFMTVIGIAGCTGLLVTGFGLRDSISEIVGKQFGELYQYNTTIALKSDDALDQNTDLRNILNDTSRIEGFLTMHAESGKLTVGDVEKEAYLYVPQEPQRLTDFIVLRERRSGKPLTFEQDTMILTEKLAETLGVKVGSKVTVRNADDAAATFTVGGIAENYAQSFVYIAPQLYEQQFGKAPAYQTLLAKATDSSSSARNALSAQLLTQEDVAAVQFTADVQESFADMVHNIDYIIIVLIVSAGLLAFVVLYNLTNINITERQKELATIKVLGFYDREVSAYIYRETAVLTLIGSAVGLVVGVFLHAFVVKTAEVDMVMFGRDIRVMSFVLSAALTMLFSLLVNLVMYRKMCRIDMVESMKAGE